MDPVMVTDTSISKINVDRQHIYLKIQWADNENDLFRVKIYAGANSWSGRFSTDFAESCRSMLDESEDVYKMNLKKAFTGTPQSPDEFKYEFVVLQDDDKTARFTWKKVFEDSAVLTHGSVPVHRDDVAESKDSLIDFLLNENKDLRETIEAFTRRNDTLTENLDKCKREMEEFVNMKTQLESSLYGKFVQLLNEKKKRIQLLEENIQKFE